MQAESKGPMAMHTIAEQAPQHQSAGSQATSGDGLLRPHTNRPSRLSAVLVPAAPASASSSAQSPPPSPPSASGPSRTAALPKVPSCDCLHQLEKQVGPHSTKVACLPSTQLRQESRLKLCCCCRSWDTFHPQGCHPKVLLYLRGRPAQRSLQYQHSSPAV
jgi:hypothetical protein